MRALPGKLLLVGEYAVLNGAPALVSAVDARAQVRVATLAGPFSEIKFSPEGAAFQFRYAAQGRLEWPENPGVEASLVEAIVQTLHDHPHWNSADRSISIVIDSRDFFSRASGVEQKLGLGSSAAVCVSLTAALLQQQGLPPDYSTVLAAHQRFQNGNGSGVDVGCCYSGGVIEYSRPIGGASSVRDLTWPTSLFVLPVWSGVAASTPQMIDRFIDYRTRKPADYDAHLADLGASSAYAISQWEAGHVASILGCPAGFQPAAASARQCGRYWNLVGYSSAIRAHCCGVGAIYKPSGAGGGDFGLAFSSDREQLQRLAESYRAQGIEVPKLAFAAKGLDVARH